MAAVAPINNQQQAVNAIRNLRDLYFVNYSDNPIGIRFSELTPEQKKCFIPQVLERAIADLEKDFEIYEKGQWDNPALLPFERFTTFNAAYYPDYLNHCNEGQLLRVQKCFEKVICIPFGFCWSEHFTLHHRIELEKFNIDVAKAAKLRAEVDKKLMKGERDYSGFKLLHTKEYMLQLAKLHFDDLRAFFLKEKYRFMKEDKQKEDRALLKIEDKDIEKSALDELATSTYATFRTRFSVYALLDKGMRASPELIQKVKESFLAYIAGKTRYEIRRDGDGPFALTHPTLKSEKLLCDAEVLGIDEKEIDALLKKED